MRKWIIMALMAATALPAAASAQSNAELRHDRRDVRHEQRELDHARRTGAEEVASISPYGKVTPTLGRKRSLFDELFGNIGTVSAAGGGTGDQGGRDTP